MTALWLASLAVISVSQAFSLLTRHQMALNSGSFTPCLVLVSQAMELGPTTTRGNTAVLQPGLRGHTIRLWGSSLGRPAIQTPFSTHNNAPLIICTRVMSSLLL